MTTRLAFRSAAREGTVNMLEAFGADAGLLLQVYRARPRSINPPCAFIDAIAEQLSNFTIDTRQRTPLVDVIVVHGLFDSGEAVNQGDAFVDGFLDWVADNYHGFGANATVDVVRTQDLPNYVPEWITDPRRTYYATVITLQGFAST